MSALCSTTPGGARPRSAIAGPSSGEEVMGMNESTEMSIRFQELDPMEAPSWDSFYQGVIGALVLIGIGAAAAT
ncbi:MpaA1 family daptide-type RiPP [Microbacterium paraoxydans]